MRSTTQVFLAANSVGDSKDSHVVFHGSFTECIMELAKWLGPRSMRKRFDIAIARSEEEAREGIRLRERTQSFAQSEGDIMEQLTRMMEEGAASTLTQPEEGVESRAESTLNLPTNSHVNLAVAPINLNLKSDSVQS